MEKERARAEAMGYPSPIQIDKSASDADFDAAVVFCLDHLDQIGLILASHNEASNLKCAQMMQDKGVPNNHPHIHFSQLYGMSDHISFNMASEGYKVSKYLPFGPLHDVIPYLMRRAQENSSVNGQTNRELLLIRQEIARRKAK
jgi:proline dehydrogenase